MLTGKEGAETNRADLHKPPAPPHSPLLSLTLCLHNQVEMLILVTPSDSLHCVCKIEVEMLILTLGKDSLTGYKPSSFRNKFSHRGDQS